MTRHLRRLILIGTFLVAGLMVVAGFPRAANAAEAGQPPPGGIFLPLAPGQSVNPEDFIRHFETMLQGQKLPPEAASFFQGMLGFMEGGAKGQDPKLLREKSGSLLQGIQPFMEKSDLPPEVAEMFRSFQGMMPKAPSDLPGN